MTTSPPQPSGGTPSLDLLSMLSSEDRPASPSAPPARGGVLVPQIEYACPPGGLVLDPTAGSCATGVAARLVGRRAVLIEADEAMCEKAATMRLAQDVLPFEEIGVPA